MATADLRLTFGAMYIGCVISVSFSGIGTLQAYYYFRQFRKRDSRLMKSTVLSAWLLDFVHTVFICQGIWHYLVLGWGNQAELDHLTWTVGASIAVTGLITIIVQMFFANRVWRLSKHNAVLTAVIVFLAFIRLGSALTTTVQMIRLQSFKAFIRDFRWLFTFGLSLSCIIDVIITSSLCYYLQGNRTGYSSIDDVLHRLLLYTINNGLLTTFASMLAMVFAAAMPNNFLFLSLHFIIAKCYVNSLLATLNSRDALKRRDDSHPMAVHISVDGPNSQPRFYKHQIVRLSMEHVDFFLEFECLLRLTSRMFAQRQGRMEMTEGQFQFPQLKVSVLVKLPPLAVSRYAYNASD
ncbi:uncharacterized protein FOMMEDRAFT_101388 [Fomitiporia mediterranea MF3/22]|uniref:uncharacterized protein n=1 Tax=Fomitiporia mediterranea (strain MF3/22) TaxID=694068 RepID=UPI0004408692|nr:uncharacterized protein FOMMEDRAFT_101388 [Fomitiporia mediterranea MF3/22]EJD07970.1 hypothetical protein FOMMEDRAFT_101388 [Fomitiporia mediterranea MF3/22]